MVDFGQVSCIPSLIQNMYFIELHTQNGTSFRASPEDLGSKVMRLESA